MVYVDNPVGAGFSYVDEDGAFTKNVAEIGQDLLAWLRQFLGLHPEYRTRPFFIFCESYGGKMSAEFARVITEVGMAFEIIYQKLFKNFISRRLVPETCDSTSEAWLWAIHGSQPWIM